MATTTLQDLRTFIPVSNIVKQAILDMYGDYEKDQARFTNWAIRAIKKLTRETLKSPKRYAMLTINKNLNNAVLPCDFKEEIGVYLLNNCNEKVPLTINPRITQAALIQDIGCEAECEAKCGCFPKQLCDDIQTTQVVNQLRIGDTLYDQTVTTTLLPGGEYYVVTTTPVLNTVTSGIDYINTKEYLTTFDLAECGCIKPTAQNSARLEHLCFDAWCCHCSECSGDTSTRGGYRIFEENSIIQFDGAMKCDKAYIEYRGFLPKSGNEYLVPEVAEDTIRELAKSYSIQNKKGVALWERREQFDHYTRERDNMTKVMGRMTLADIIHSALLVPKFNYNFNRNCWTDDMCNNEDSSSENATATTSNITAMANTTDTDCCCKQIIITIQGIEMDNGVTYINSILSEAIDFRIFANPFNRFMNTDEYIKLPQGGFTLLTGIYGLGDWFDIFLKNC